MRYENKVALITGGSKGIGEGCVRVFVQEGAKVVFCARGVPAGQKLQDELNAKGLLIIYKRPHLANLNITK